MVYIAKEVSRAFELFNAMPNPRNINNVGSEYDGSLNIPVARVLSVVMLESPPCTELRDPKSISKPKILDDKLKWYQ